MLNLYNICFIVFCFCPLIYGQDLVNLLKTINAAADVINCASQTNCEDCLSQSDCVICADGQIIGKLLNQKSTLASGSYCWTGSFNYLSNNDLEELGTGIELTCNTGSIHSESCVLSDIGIIIIIVISLLVLFLCCCCCCYKNKNKKQHLHNYQLVPINVSNDKFNNSNIPLHIQQN